MTSRLQGRVVVVTGANAGLGYQLSLALARMGAHVVMACRDPQRAELARAQLLSEAPQARATTLRLDLADPASIREFARAFDDSVGELDILVHNAGIFGVPLSRNAAGYEMHLATNYLGPFALTGLLLPRFRDAPGARVVSVGSLAHRFGKLCLDDPNGREADYSGWKAYASSKVALMAYTMELDRRLRQQGGHMIALGAHPGMAPTDIAKHHAVANPKSVVGKWFKQRMEAWIPSVADAARPILHAACAQEVAGGEYYGPGGLLEVAGDPGKARIAPRALDEEVARQLWATSESLTGVRYLSS